METPPHDPDASDDLPAEEQAPVVHLDEDAAAPASDFVQSDAGDEDAVPQIDEASEPDIMPTPQSSLAAVAAAGATAPRRRRMGESGSARALFANLLAFAGLGAFWVWTWSATCSIALDGRLVTPDRAAQVLEVWENEGANRQTEQKLYKTAAAEKREHLYASIGLAVFLGVGTPLGLLMVCWPAKQGPVPTVADPELAQLWRRRGREMGRARFAGILVGFAGACLPAVWAAVLLWTPAAGDRSTARFTLQQRALDACFPEPQYPPARAGERDPQAKAIFSAATENVLLIDYKRDINQYANVLPKRPSPDIGVVVLVDFVVIGLGLLLAIMGAAMATGRRALATAGLVAGAAMLAFAASNEWPRLEQWRGWAQHPALASVPWPADGAFFVIAVVAVTFLLLGRRACARVLRLNDGIRAAARMMAMQATVVDTLPVEEAPTRSPDAAEVCPHCGKLVAFVADQCPECGGKASVEPPPAEPM